MLCFASVCVFFNTFRIFLSFSTQVQTRLLRFKWCFNPINMYHCCNCACLRHRQLDLNLFEQWRNSGGVFHWGKRKGDLTPVNSRLRQELSRVLRSESHKAPPGLTWWDPCEGMVWTASMRPCEWFWKGGQLNPITTPPKVAVNNGVSSDTFQRT